MERIFLSLFLEVNPDRYEVVMLDHFGFVVKDLKLAINFYENCLAQVDLKIIERHEYGAVIFAQSEKNRIPFIWIGVAKPDFWRDFHQPSNSPLHLCFSAKSRESVDNFYSAALAFGGKDNGGPGDRATGYYAAYVIDPDGNNIEASFRY